MSGSQVHYRIQWISYQPTNVRQHLVVLNAWYEELHLPALKDVSQESGKAPNQVLSSEVQLVRLQSLQGSSRAVTLLTELIRVEKEIEAYVPSLPVCCLLCATPWRSRAFCCCCCSEKVENERKAKEIEDNRAKRERKRARAKRLGVPVKEWDVEPPKQSWRGKDGAEGRRHIIESDIYHPGACCGCPVRAVTFHAGCMLILLVVVWQARGNGFTAKTSSRCFRTSCWPRAML